MLGIGKADREQHDLAIRRAVAVLIQRLDLARQFQARVHVRLGRIVLATRIQPALFALVLARAKIGQRRQPDRRLRRMLLHVLPLLLLHLLGIAARSDATACSARCRCWRNCRSAGVSSSPFCTLRRMVPDSAPALRDLLRLALRSPRPLHYLPLFVGELPPLCTFCRICCSRASSADSPPALRMAASASAQRQLPVAGEPGL